MEKTLAEITRFVHPITHMLRFTLLLFLLPFVSVAQTTCSLSGEGWNVPDNTVLRLIRNGESSPSQEAKVVAGKFKLSIPLREPTLYFLVEGDQTRSVEIFLEPGKVTVRPAADQPGEYEVTGSPSHVEFKAFVRRILPIVQSTNQWANAINTSSDAMQRDSLMVLYQGAQAQMQQVIDSTIDANPNSTIAPFTLLVTYGFNQDPLLLERRFQKLSLALQGTETGKQVATMIADSKVGAVGSLATDFTQADENGNPISLSSFRGKYVLLDFWASWCGPCRSENPNVVENYNKFKNKNFTVLGVSLDRPGQKDRWLQAIQEDKLTWTHVSDLQFWNNAVAKKYKVQSIPQNYLIDPDGMIIAKNLRGEELGKKLCEVLGCN